MALYRFLLLGFLLVQILQCTKSIQPTSHKTDEMGHGKPANKDSPSTVSTASSWSSSTSWDSVLDDWVKQPAKKLYRKAIPLVFGTAKEDKGGTSDEQMKRPVEQYEIFGMWRLSLNDGDDMVLMEIRPHDLSYGRKHKILKYTFHSSVHDKEETSRTTKVLLSTSSTIRFERDNRVYTAKLTRRRIEDEDNRRQRTVLKINGRIEKKSSSTWWWLPQRRIGTFAGRKLAYHELSRDEAKIWASSDNDKDDETTASSVTTETDDWNADDGTDEL